MNKLDVLTIVAAMPDDIDFDDLLYRLRLRHKLDLAEQAVREGRVLSHQQVVRRSESWFR